MNIEQLRYVVEVSHSQSISAAAQQLYVTPSAISQSIIHLEEELGIRLFHRARQGVTVTPEGASIIRLAREICEKLDQLQAEAARHQASIQGQLKLAAVAGAMPLLMQAIVEFKTANPALRFEVSEMSSGQIAEALQQQEIDLGVMVHRHADRQRPLLHKLVFQSLTSSALVALLPRSPYYAGRSSISVHELRHHPVILYNDEYLHWFVDHLERQHGPLNIILRTNNIEVIHSVMLQNLGMTIGFMLQAYRSGYQGTFVSLPLDEYKEEQLDIGWAYSPKHPPTDIARAFMDRCADLVYDPPAPPSG